MKVIQTKDELRAELAQRPGSTALVMTMGALHEGHLTLVQQARESADNVVVSIFVNPLQFGPGEDYEAYPRDLVADVKLLEPCGVDVVFAPEPEVVYPRTPLVRIDPGPIATMYEGATRPIHFAGVLQVVNKVLNLVRPDIAFFGQKDAQQLALISTMVADLDMPVEIKAVPIKREETGLALSSRNAYLSDEERIEALAINQALVVGRDAGARGARAETVRTVAENYLAEAPGVKLDYLALVDPDTFEEIRSESDATRGLLITAAWVGSTRLIDNLEVQFDA